MVTGGPEDIRNGPHMLTAFQEEIPCCSPGTSSGKQKKARSSSQPQFRRKNTPATIEADQILLALQQLATNSNSANFNNNSNRLSKLPKSLTTALPIFDRISEKFWTVWRSIPNGFKNPQSAHRRTQNKLFPLSHACWCAADVRKHQQPERGNLAEILTVFRKKYLKPQSMAAAKHKFQHLVFNLANQKLIEFLEELQKLAEDALGVAPKQSLNNSYIPRCVHTWRNQ